MVLNGIDNIELYDDYFRAKRLGLITSISGVDIHLNSSIDILHKRYGLSALFGPEHGVRGNAAAGAEVESYLDPCTNVMVYSLYRSDSKRLTDEMLETVDAVVYDIQDLGVRFYTFISTMYFAMQECNRVKKEMIILDRLNPLGDRVDGILLKKEYESFVGAYSLPIRYGLTVGELAQMIYAEQRYAFPLKIIPIQGWNRHQMFPETQNLWVMPSMAIPRFDTAFLYAGLCLTEGTNLSEGRGTSAPFEIIGAPYLNGEKLAKHLNRIGIPGVLFSPVYFSPSASKYEETACEGVHIHVTDFERCRPLEVALRLIGEIRKWYPEQFAFTDPYRPGGRRMIELLLGDSVICEKSFDCEEFLQQCEAEGIQFSERKKAYQIY